MGGGVKKFKGRRTHRAGQMSVATGFHEGEVKFRIPLPTVGAVTLTRQQAWDLAECLDEALDDQDQQPIT
jgi:hypothetical protein